MPCGSGRLVPSCNNFYWPNDKLHTHAANQGLLRIPISAIGVVLGLQRLDVLRRAVSRPRYRPKLGTKAWDESLGRMELSPEIRIRPRHVTSVSDTRPFIIKLTQMESSFNRNRRLCTVNRSASLVNSIPSFTLEGIVLQPTTP
jgi:hypothetical protein